MNANVGGVDKWIRIIAGITLLALVFILRSEDGLLWLWGLIGIVPLASGLLNWCPAYELFGINTCSVCKKE